MVFLMLKLYQKMIKLLKSYFLDKVLLILTNKILNVLEDVKHCEDMISQENCKEFNQKCCSMDVFEKRKNERINYFYRDIHINRHKESMLIDIIKEIKQL